VEWIAGQNPSNLGCDHIEGFPLLIVQPKPAGV
jgi:hypothetical protein